MTDPRHAWPPPHAAHRRRGGQHRAVVVRHPRRVVSVATGLAGVLVVALTATMSPQAAVDRAVPPAQAAAAPAGPVPVFQLPAGSGVVVWPVRQVVDTDPITDTDTAEANETTATEPPAQTTTTSHATPETTTEADATTQPPAPSTTTTRTRHPRPTVATCSPGGAT